MITQITDGRNTVEIDRKTKALKCIEIDHNRVHAGRTFRASIIPVISGNGTATALSFVTSNNFEEAHFLFDVHTEQETKVALWESVAITANTGNDVIPMNANRNSTRVSGMVGMKEGATINLTGATLLEQLVIGAGGGNPGQTERSFEWNLKRNKAYAIVCTNLAGGADQISILANWYEQPITTETD